MSTAAVNTGLVPDGGGVPEAVVVTSSMRPRDHFRVAMMMVLRSPAGVVLLMSGPALWAYGTVARSATVHQAGALMSWLLVLVPAFAALVGSYSAYRPGSSALYEPVTWTFSPEGIDIVQPTRRAMASWDEFRSWRVVGGCYLLHTRARHYVIIAARDVPAGDRARFEALLAARLGRHRR
ncbi:MAG TPA: YcxB family protein [Coriobacteriia bacterium]